MEFAFTQEHGYALLATLLVAFESSIFGMMVGRVRSRVFNANFMVDKFGGLHLQTFNADISKNGYPDMGNGRYSDALSYKDWVDFNNAQRGHYNHLENVNGYVTYLLVASIVFPFEAAILGAILFFGRLGYAISYNRGGSDDLLRRLSSSISFLCNIVLFGYAIASCYHIINFGLVGPTPSSNTPAPVNDTPTTTPTETPADNSADATAAQ